MVEYLSKCFVADNMVLIFVFTLFFSQITRYFPLNFWNFHRFFFSLAISMPFDTRKFIKQMDDAMRMKKSLRLKSAQVHYDILLILFGSFTNCHWILVFSVCFLFDFLFLNHQFEMISLIFLMKLKLNKWTCANF